MRSRCVPPLPSSAASGRFEEEAYACGYQAVAGLDEVGRGPWAGPVVAAAVILPREFLVSGFALGTTRSFDGLPSINSGPELVEGRIDPEQASTDLVRLRLTTEVSRMSGRTGRNS
mgnify:CR=1 FL=1